VFNIKHMQAAVLVGVALAFAAPAAKAEVYKFDFTSADSTLTAMGTFTVSAGEITDISGTLAGSVAQTIDQLVPNSNFPAYSTSPGGAFYYDNAFFPGSDPHLDVGGVLFTTFENAGGYWNLWGTAPGAYSFWESTPNGYAVTQTGGTLTVTAVPEPATWVMLLLGFAGLGYAERRNSAKGPALRLAA
jgi:PEP-CTERM motif